MRKTSLFALGFIVFIGAAPAPAADDFPLKDGDLWVMAGDSITAQHMHSNYFEAFCYARYPRLKFAFRNSGVGGHTIPSTLARFDYDIAAWAPTIVSVELGMNDKGSTPTAKFVDNMGTMVGRIRGIKARPVILSASPVNNGETTASLNQNKRLSEYAAALKEFSAKEKIPYADQFHALVDIWGRNRSRENILNAARAAIADEGLAGSEQLKAFLAAQEKNPAKIVSLQGDAVHPGVPGQLMMTAALLKELGANGFVGSAVIDASGKLVDAKGCAVSEIVEKEGTLAFDRLDECLPFPIPDEARTTASFYPAILDLSQYSLKVNGLKGNLYVLKINGVTAATLSAKELGAGVNLTTLAPARPAKDASPIAAQSRAILAAVASKEGIVGQWRGLSQRAHAKGATADLKAELAALTKKVEEADQKIRDAAKPQKLHFELAPVQ